MFTSRSTIFIERPINQIMPYVVEPKRWQLWVDEQTNIRSESSPLTQGSRYVQTVNGAWDVMIFQGTILKLQPAKEISFSQHCPSLEINGQYSFRQNQNGTYVTYQAKPRERTIPSLLMAPLTRLAIKKRALQSLSNLKKVCEDKA